MLLSSFVRCDHHSWFTGCPYSKRGVPQGERERYRGGRRIQGADPFPIIMVLILIIMMIIPIIMVIPSLMMIVLIMVHGALIARWVCLGERYREGEGET